MSEHEQMRTAVRAYLLTEHRDLITTVLACADTVIDDRLTDADHDGVSVDDGLADPLREQLEHRGVVERLPAVLVGASNAMGESLSAEPVGAPPYVVVTNVGPLVRATFDTRRLVITINAFRVNRDTRQYMRTTSNPSETLSVEIHNNR